MEWGNIKNLYNGKLTLKWNMIILLDGNAGPDVCTKQGGKIPPKNWQRKEESIKKIHHERACFEGISVKWNG